MLRLTPDFARPRPQAKASTLRSIYDAASTGWQDGISKLGFIEAYAHLMHATPPPGPEARVMDVGTGTGAFAQAWVNAHGAPSSLTLTDISPAMLAAAAKRLPRARTIPTALGAPIPDLPAQDVVICAHVIEHLDDPNMALKWLFEQLVPGGTLVLALSRPHWCTALVRWRWGNAAYTPETACGMLQQAGFNQVTSHPFPAGPPARVSCGYIARRP